jgi:hypothetical protein
MASKESGKDDLKLVNQLIRDNQAGHALVVAQTIHEQVGDLIALRMPRLSKTMRDRLFSGCGPLSVAFLYG